MSIQTSAPLVFADLLEQLTKALGVEQRFGTKEEAAMTSASRVVWVPTTGPSVEPSPFNLDLADAPYRQLAHFLVQIYGSSLDEVLQRHADLAGWLDYIAGPEQGAPASDDVSARPGFKIGNWMTAPQAIDPGGSTWSGVVLVTLKTMATRRVFKSTIVTGAGLEIDVTAPDGTGSQTFVNTEVDGP